jgi:transglutaminase-like putative cysteine protease
VSPPAKPGVYFQLISDNQAPYCLHGLNAIYLDSYGWYRVDPRGNKPGVHAQFTPPIEQLAYSTVVEGEKDLPEIWAEPLSIIVQALENGKRLSNNFEKPS